MDWIAAVFYFIGVFLLGEKRKEGFLCYAVENILWVVVALRLHLHGLLLVTGVGCVLQIRNYLKWRRQE